MKEVGIRALKQNASAVVADVVAGETVVITDRGRPVAQLTEIPLTTIQRLVAAGRARPARRPMSALPPPQPGPNVTRVLLEARDDERY